jgi:ABC-2 type transport system permease protein
MFKRVLNFFLRDINSFFRDNIFIIMIVMPIAVAVIIRFFIPTVEASSISFAVDDSVGEEFAEQLEDYGNIVRYDDPEQVKERVNGNDDIIGMTKEGDQYVIILEGNESDEIKEIAPIVIDDILRGGPVVEIDHETIGSSRSLFREYSAIMVVFMIIFVQGMLIAFYIIEEKESKVVYAIAVSPMRLWQYFMARWLLVVITGTVLSVIASLVLMGTGISYTLLIIGAVFASCLSVVVGLLIGGMAGNQIAGIAIMKVLNLIIFLIPIASIFVHDPYQYFFYPFPNYWVFRVLKNIFIDTGNIGDFWMSCGITLASSVVMLMIIMPFLKRRIEVR